MTIDNSNELTKQILLAASKLGARLWRRNIGQAWIGRAKRFDKDETVALMQFKAGDVLIRSARPFHSGEAGQADLYGWTPTLITADMVGQMLPVHTEVEIKFGKDRMSEDQDKWLAFCQKQKVRAGVARTVEDAERIISGTR